MSRYNKFMSRPAGLSSDSETDDFEFGSDVRPELVNFTAEDENVTVKSCERESNSVYSDDKAGEAKDIREGLGSCQNAESLEQEKVQFGSSKEPSVVLNQNGHISNGYPSMNRNNDCKFRDRNDDDTVYSETGSSISGSNGRKFKMSPRNRRRFQTNKDVDLPLEDLRMATEQGNLTVVKDIISQGISADQILKSGWTALMFASSFARPDIVKYLLQQGSDPNIHKEMFTALMAACASSQNCEKELLACVNHLLDYGAKADATERHRVTPFMFACKEGRVSIVERLYEAKVDINKQDNKGWTALCWAAMKGHGLVVRRLLELSADPSKMNNHGQRPADVALAAGHIEIADILERATRTGLQALSDDDVSKLERPQSFSSLPRNLGSSSPSTVTQCDEMEMILSGLSLNDLFPLFLKHKITLESFLRLCEDDFMKMGIDAIGTRKKLLTAIADIHKQEWKTSSLPNLTKLTYITLPDAVAMVQNVNRHLQYIHASINYLRDQIQTTPRILELGQEKHSVATLSSSFSDSIKNLSLLNEDIKFFKAHLDKVSGNVEYCPADTITIRRDNRLSWLHYLVYGAVVGVGVYFLKPPITKFFSAPLRQSSVLLDVSP